MSKRNLDEMNGIELYDLARELNLKGRSKYINSVSKLREFVKEQIGGDLTKLETEVSGLKNLTKKIADIMDYFDEAIEIAMDSEDPDRMLFNLYTIVRKELKETKGAGKGFTGFLEYFYLRYIIKTIERNFAITGDKVQLGEGYDRQYFFEFKLKNQTILISSDIKLAHFKDLLYLGEKFLNKQPDIFIGVKKDDQFFPIALIEIKMAVEPKKIRKEIIERFQGFKALFEKEGVPLPYFAFINFLCSNTAQRIELMSKFLAISEKSLLIRFIKGDPGWKDGVWQGRFDENGISISNLMEKVIKRLMEL